MKVRGELFKIKKIYYFFEKKTLGDEELEIGLIKKCYRAR
jgi:hypothetical protein